MAGAQCKEAKSHLYAALYLRHTEAGCEESILAAIATAPDHKKAYMSGGALGENGLIMHGNIRACYYICTSNDH